MILICKRKSNVLNFGGDVLADETFVLGHVGELHARHVAVVKRLSSLHARNRERVTIELIEHVG